MGLKDRMRMGRNAVALGMALMIVLSCSMAMATPEQGVAGAPEVPQALLTEFSSMSVVDVTAGATVLERGEAESFSPSGSAVTLMNAYIIATDMDLAETVTVSADLSMLSEDARKLGIADGETWLVGDLVAAMALHGAQDAAVILAQYAADSMSAFVERMNERAAQLGMVDTKYANAYGAYDIQQMTTTHDLLILAEAVARNETLREILSRASYTPQGKNRIDNRLRLMQEGAPQYDARVTGMGAGTTSQAGTNMIIAATAGGRELLLALHLSSTDSAVAEGQVAALLDHFFDAYRLADATRRVIDLAGRTQIALTGGGAAFGAPKGDVYVLAGLETAASIEAGEGEMDLRLDYVADSEGEPGEWIATAMLLYEGAAVAQVELVTVAAEGQGVDAPVQSAPQQQETRPSDKQAYEIPLYTDGDWQPAPKVTLWERYDWLIIIAAAAVACLAMTLLAIPIRKRLR